MLSKEIAAVLRRIGLKTSIKAKSLVLKDNIGDPELREVLKMAMSPYITFGVGKKTLDEALSMSGDFGKGNFADETWELLEKLANRELTGDAAKQSLQEEFTSLNEPSAELLRLILLKDLGIGLGASSVNKIEKNLIPEYKVMLAKKYDVKRLTLPSFVEPKLDGLRVCAHVILDEDSNEYTVSFHSREGHPFTSLAKLEKPLIELVREISVVVEGDNYSWFIDGEVTVNNSFKDSVSDLRKKDFTCENPMYHIFHAQPFDTFIARKPYLHYRAVRGVLQEAFKCLGDSFARNYIELNPAYFVNSESEIHAIYANVRAQKLEGVMIKHPDAKYAFTRSIQWMKIKDKVTVDLRIVDIEEGQDRLEGTLGAIIVDYKGVRVNVGSGLSDADRTAVWDDPDQFIDSIVEISFHEETEAGSLRHPVFERFRADKNTVNTESA